MVISWLFLGVEPLKEVVYIQNMPTKYLVRNLRENSYYHAYNRGVGEESIFRDEQDYKMFLFYLDIYTSPLEAVCARYSALPPRLTAKNLGDDIRLVAYCLMPDHFHLLVKQESTLAMPQLLKQVTNGYTTYFNSKYKRGGRLMQGRYRAVLIESEYLLIQMVRFVHLNSSFAGLCKDPGDYAWSSYKQPLHTNGLLNRFVSAEEWKKFHLDQNSYQLNLPKIKALTLD